VTGIKIGVTLPQFSGDAAQLRDAAQRAEAVRLDSLWVFDHLWPLSGGKERPILEGWTTLAWLGTITKSIGVGTLVTRSSLRHPAVLAKMTATVATIAPERLTVAVGSGDELSRAENESFGLPFYESVERPDQLRSTVEVLHRALSGPSVSQSDDFVELRDLPVSPAPPVPPKVWVAGRSPAVLDIAGDLADGWNGWQGSPTRFREDVARVQARAAGRDLEFSWGGILILGRDDAEAQTVLGERDPRGFLVGGPETVGLRLRSFVEAGARHLTLTFAGPWRDEALSLLSSEVRSIIDGEA
jgi:alkanesulfonate monooxygenase SsuD/methylene tetrahydromethanopterin reductase-like flavin-dependent oxidoreductase (luciferase family)